MEECKGLGEERGARKEEEEEEEEGREEVCVTPLSITGNYCVFTSAKSTKKGGNPHRHSHTFQLPLPSLKQETISLSGTCTRRHVWEQGGEPPRHWR
ncbi:hypothetical protein NGA_0130300 [Nannochloropsis gaditana CCMP526]|uniref:uncharacterized protein n=1 Tax=Nannochloropsis gaditana (strain CCMP526) TaxID=1093141 RepID=UPI00029F5DC3|nr:hypothetical protein NGA_0130300 [Nannochloropsis gaditana CCMP526]EKU21195.1 hypothetical protein NGA_0130300 [Nannochloropsis gaditana CCMP526]|eukprot:XP_005855171.1 hypothetical protein NGA_0130300 [Nannochloropsis gaditana CCMP526]